MITVVCVYKHINVYYHLRMRSHEFENEWKGHKRNLREENTYSYNIIIFKESRNKYIPATSLWGI